MTDHALEALRELAEVWRQQADGLEANGDHREAHTLRTCSNEMWAAMYAPPPREGS